MRIQSKHRGRRALHPALDFVFAESCSLPKDRGGLLAARSAIWDTGALEVYAGRCQGLQGCNDARVFVSQAWRRRNHERRDLKERRHHRFAFLRDANVRKEACPRRRGDPASGTITALHKTYCQALDRVVCPQSRQPSPISTASQRTSLSGSSGTDMDSCPHDVLVFPALLGFLTLPCLETLHLDTSAWIDDAVITLLERSRCWLKTLVILDNAQTDLSPSMRFLSLCKLLRRDELFPSLEELVIGHSVFDNDTAETLMGPSALDLDRLDPPIPTLRRIHFTDGMVYTASQLSPARLAALLRSRYDGTGVKLKLSMGKWHWVKQSPAQDLRKLYSPHHAGTFRITCDKIPDLKDFLWTDEATGGPLDREEMIPTLQAARYRKRLLERVSPLEEEVDRLN